MANLLNIRQDIEMLERAPVDRWRGEYVLDLLSSMADRIEQLERGLAKAEPTRLIELAEMCIPALTTYDDRITDGCDIGDAEAEFAKVARRAIKDMLSPNVEVTGAARLYRAASGGPQGWASFQ